MNTQKGFTLIELVVVIVVLGILAAVAIPNYINLQTQAAAAGTAGVAGALSSASAMNLASCKAGGTCVAATANPTACSVFIPLLAGAAMPTGYTLSGSNNLSAVGVTGLCTVTHTSTGQTAIATVFGTS